MLSESRRHEEDLAIVASTLEGQRSPLQAEILGRLAVVAKKFCTWVRGVPLDECEMGNLERLKVSELKDVLKYHAQVFSGNKPQLVNRIAVFLGEEIPVGIVTAKVNWYFAGVLSRLALCIVSPLR